MSETDLLLAEGIKKSPSGYSMSGKIPSRDDIVDVHRSQFRTSSMDDQQQYLEEIRISNNPDVSGLADRSVGKKIPTILSCPFC